MVAGLASGQIGFDQLLPGLMIEHTTNVIEFKPPVLNQWSPGGLIA
jgi:hypothetical protein